MHRARTLSALSLAALLATAALPAQAKPPHPGQRGGKKPVGEIVSFDAATSALVVDVAGDEDLTATVAADAQVKLEHRGSHRRSKGHGNPSKGSLEDLAAGALVLRLKVEEDEVTKIRLRPAPTETPAETPPIDDDSEESTDAGDAAPGDDSPDDDVLDDTTEADAGTTDDTTDDTDPDGGE